ncbi:ATPase associated with various cellular activities AAA_5 [Halorubrum distributum JCM 9100]|uniref:ATPase associated with various cellular activities AAA_5 n=3 Tax=Halorubrum distributum TaxID=29283 RepID=M0ESQ1_9EURY|nr:ATPase associated with various cellular activities AAA_5 [Halorubrum distributum JCM 9100]ELZ52851.1 ATPase associated with various cellular activities AAA_5 [Halorubrum distributum JCM 10118]
MLPHPSDGFQVPNSLKRRLGDVGQLIFYGPPGTGKTFTATELARQWVYSRTDTPTDTQVQTVTFHPSVSYEDFVEGLTATKSSGEDAVTYKYEAGTFKEIYEEARDAYERTDGDEPPRYVLIIDEINRGNVPQILGELISLLESDKRLDEPQQTSVQAAHSGEKLTLPPNLYIIGTMNTADQSIALIDAAIRRRFSFHPFPPDTQVIIEKSSLLNPDKDDIDTLAEESSITPKSLLARSIKAIETLNERIVDGDPGRGQRLGHTYLMGVKDTTDICDTWQFDILPLLEEYYFGNVDRLRADLLTNDDDDEPVADVLFDTNTGEVRPEIQPSEIYSALGEIVGIQSSDDSSDVINED